MPTTSLSASSNSRTKITLVSKVIFTCINKKIAGTSLRQSFRRELILQVMNYVLKLVLITIVIIILILILVLILTTILIVVGANVATTTALRRLSKEVANNCAASSAPIFDHPLTLPEVAGEYDRSVAITLQKISDSTSRSNCKETVVAPPFTNFKHILGVSPNGGNSVLVAIIYWVESNHPTTNSSIICVAFSGTYYSFQFDTDLQVALVEGSILNGYSRGVQVHQGFFNTYRSVRNQLKNFIVGTLGLGTTRKNLFLTGNSLGGALSTIAAYDYADIVKNGGGQLVHYTFSAPRVGNISFSENYDRRVPNGIRIYNTEDAVIILPPSVISIRGVSIISRIINSGVIATESIATGTLVNDNITSSTLVDDNVEDDNTITSPGYYLYQHVCAKRGAIPFTKNLGTIFKNHIDAYPLWLQEG